MSIKKKNILGGLFKQKDCGCGIQIVSDESKVIKNSQKKIEK